LAVTVSLDEPAFGFGIGRLSLALAPVLGLIAVGLRERGEQIAGGLLLCLAAALLVLRLLGRAP
jgi:hypothetical protein